MTIEGSELLEARLRAGFTSQRAAAAAAGVSQRTFGEWERNQVPKHQVDRVRAIFWPRTSGEPSLASFSDMALLSEIGRRLAEYKRDSDQSSTRGEDEPSESTTTVPEGRVVGGTRTGRRDALHPEGAADDAE